MNRLITSLFCILCIGSVVAQNTDNYLTELNAHRDKYKMDFLKDERSPLKATDLKDLDFFNADEYFCLSCSYELLKDQKESIMPTYSGKEKSFVKHVKFTCPLSDGFVYFYGYKNTKSMNMPMYRNQVFIPFKDKTNGKSTYGGGRYLDVDMEKDNHNGKITVDLNKAYNPWCCYSDGFNCPIPPTENTQAIAIKAGEKMFKGDKKP